MTDERDEIRARIDIIDLVSQRVSLKRSGKRYTGLCPFHDDKNPSFQVDPQTGRYTCWSCKESGDIFTWVMKTENVEFSEAIQSLAERAGVSLKSRGKAVPPSLREAHRESMAEALAFFREQLQSHPAALDYCRGRGLEQSTLDEWEIGYAPDVGEALVARLKKKGLSLSEAKSLFLVDESASGGFYDRFRSRLMFPIRDEKGDLVAFGGRLLGNGHPKYINSSDTPMYKKSRVLYGMNRARDFMAKERVAVLVEGYLDVIACHRSGVSGSIASLGTALGEDHAKLLKRWCDQVTVLYDSDAAGQKAAERAIEILDAEGLRVRIALMPVGEDPDTLLRTAGPAAVREAAARGVTPTTFRVGRLEERLSYTDDEFWLEVAQILSSATESLEVDEHLVRLSSHYPGLQNAADAYRRLSGMVEDVRRQGRNWGQGTNRRPVPESRHGRQRSAPIKAAPEFLPFGKKMLSQELIVFRALHEPPYQRFAWMTIVREPEIFATEAAAKLARAIATAYPNEPPEGQPSVWLYRIEPEEERAKLGDLSLDFRSSNLVEDVITDSITYLRQNSENREFRRRRQTVLSQEERQEILNRLRKLNPDPLQKPKEDEDDPYA